LTIFDRRVRSRTARIAEEEGDISPNVVAYTAPDEHEIRLGSRPAGRPESWLDKILLIRRAGACLVNCAPDALGGGGHFDVTHAERGEGVDDGVDDGTQRRGGAALAAGAQPSGLVDEGTSLRDVFISGKRSARGIA
jgi:hypothetical protein